MLDFDSWNGSEYLTDYWFPQLPNLLSSIGLLLNSLFTAIVATHYVLWNWNVVSDFSRFINWSDTFTYEKTVYGFDSIVGGGDGFVEGWRVAVDGFPIIQAVFEPLGIVLACVGVVWWLRRKAKGQAGQGV